jgi:hypothetical protein
MDRRQAQCTQFQEHCGSQGHTFQAFHLGSFDGSCRVAVAAQGCVAHAGHLRAAMGSEALPAPSTSSPCRKGYTAEAASTGRGLFQETVNLTRVRPGSTQDETCISWRSGPAVKMCNLVPCKSRGVQQLLQQPPSYSRLAARGCPQFPTTRTARSNK